ncbi:MAG: Holliday junction resolvase RuvX [Rikenellaceae bacterium]|jgi:putative Holliday junction resolvase|nr:Holliday junction resolvase RuvX [Rikenellaceae bacterium]
MGRILALDYGRKRTGVAVTDPLQLIANGLETVETHHLEVFLENYLGKETVDVIVVGLPRQMNNTPSESYTYIKPFVEKLRKKHPEINIEWVDERFTSKIAQRAIIEGGVKKSDRRDKGLVDRVSATVILQSYLESRDIFQHRTNATL